jgi:hypothetical protein
MTNLGSPLLDSLVAAAELPPLDAGKPDAAARPRLVGISIESLLAPAGVVDSAMASCCLSGLWLWHNFLDESHRLSQEIETQSGAYWHGLMHRREGDFSNAKYWFRSVGRHPAFGEVQAAAAQLAAGVDDPAARKLAAAADWDPFAFIDLCQKCVGSGSRAEHLCREFQLAEYRALMKYCRDRAVGE